MVDAQFVQLSLIKSDLHGMLEKSFTEDLKHAAYCQTAKTPEGFVSLYLEVGVDLHQQSPCNPDIIGDHHLPLEDGQRNVGAWGQIRICNWLQGHWSGLAVCLGVTLKRYNLHVGHSL